MKLYLQLLILFLIVSLNSCLENGTNIELNDIKQGARLILDDASFNKIKRKRNEALKRNLLIKSKDDYVFGSIQANGKSINVKARLKGDHVDHLKGKRWSFRIVSTNGSILNHKKISIQGVHTRAYLKEWIFHKVLAQENIVNLQYEFFPFCVNDSLCGIYALESHFDNFLLERSNRPFGPIMKFSEDEFWDSKIMKDDPQRDEKLMQRAQIEFTNLDWCSKKENIEYVNTARTNLDKFRNNQMPAEAVFDLSFWATYIAVNELMEGNHALRWHNLRFYFNPNTNKIEPIGFDCGAWGNKEKIVYSNDSTMETFHALLFKNELYKNQVQQELKRLSKKDYMKDFFEKNESELQEEEKKLQQEKSDYKFWKSAFYNSQNRIKQQISN